MLSRAGGHGGDYNKAFLPPGAAIRVECIFPLLSTALIIYMHFLFLSFAFKEFLPHGLDGPARPAPYAVLTGSCQSESLIFRRLAAQASSPGPLSPPVTAGSHVAGRAASALRSHLAPAPLPLACSPLLPRDIGSLGSLPWLFL